MPGVTDLGAGKIAKIVWKGLESQEVKVEGGELRGLLDIRDGDGEGLNYRGLVYYLNKLNEFARIFPIKSMRFTGKAMISMERQDVIFSMCLKKALMQSTA